MTDYYSFYLSYIKYSEDQASQPKAPEVVKFVTDDEVRRAYRQYLITYLSAQALGSFGNNAKTFAMDMVSSLGW